MSVFPDVHVLAMAAPPGGPSPLWQFLPFAAILAIFYFLILAPMKRRQRKIQDFQSALKVGDQVVTTGGIYGEIRKLDEQTVQLQVSDGVRIKIARAAIGGYQGQAPVVPEAGS
jgi:preprotein translocase subunit YajC